MFQDVEFVRQRDVFTGRKRNSDGTQKVNSATLQERCRPGIGSFVTPQRTTISLYKRPRF